MRMTRFYLPKPLAPGSTIELGPEASHHALTVLRMGTGDALTVFNGEGGEYTATVIAASKKTVVIETGAFDPRNLESSLVTHLAIGISKGERFDLVLQKATELGVSEITPLVTERTEVRLSQERQEKIRLRWQTIVINACEQCQRNRLPKLNPPVELRNLLAVENSEKKFILHHHSEHPLDKGQSPKSVCLLVGPEGGFSDMEFKLATQCGFTPLALGPRVLRTETAPLAALSVVQALWGDLA